MATAITKLIERDYTLKNDEGTTDPTIFKLRALTGLQRIAVRQAVGESNEEKLHRLLLAYGLAGWEKFKDADGKPVAWAPNNIDRNIDRLSEPDIVELAKNIFDNTFLTDDERKN